MDNKRPERRVKDNNDDDQHSFDSEDVLPLSTMVRKGSAITNRQKFTWSKSDLVHTEPVFPETDRKEYRNMAPVDAFEKIFDDEVFQFLADQRADLRNQMVYEAMRRDRFDIIMRYLHCADNNDLDKQDKMAKLRPFMELLKLRFKNHFIPEREIDYDESMIEYFGRHGCKQFIRGKPIRFGYKAWCINTKSDYLINFEILVYQGNIPGVKTGDQKLVGKASAPLLKFIAELSSEIRLLPFRFYFDNLFTSMSLLMYLDSCGYSATGTMPENRVPKNCPIKPVKSMKKEKRGVFEYATTKVDGSSVIITRWMDNSVVTVASTCHGVNPITSAKRYSVAEKKQIVIARPKNIAAYNNFMGGTDQMDTNLNVYRIGVRGKKWWWPIFTWLVDVSIQNAWILQKSDGRNMSQLEFSRQIAQCWLTRYKNMPKHCGRPQSTGQSSARILPAIRYDRLDHLLNMSLMEKEEGAQVTITKGVQFALNVKNVD
nr:unnamed protein product [Callosobruchus chinensis]